MTTTRILAASALALGLLFGAQAAPAPFGFGASASAAEAIDGDANPIPGTSGNYVGESNVPVAGAFASAVRAPIVVVPVLDGDGNPVPGGR
jgi:hypothetical protein